MKKGFFAKFAVSATACILACSCLAACGGETRTVYELPHYDGTEYTGTSDKPNQTDLWRRNNCEVKTGSYGDPQIFDNTQRDGYYYHYYGTTARRTKTFLDDDWEFMGEVVETDGQNDQWAVEVVYDDETEKYYLFTSGTPEEAGTGIDKALVVYVSDIPEGPFKHVDYTDPQSVGAENVRQIDTTAHPSRHVKTMVFDPDALREKMIELCPDLMGRTPKKYQTFIDPSPYVDENGDKYLYFTWLINPNVIFGVKMKNWLTPDISTLKPLTVCGYYTVQDYYDKSRDLVRKEAGLAVNEGAQVVKHNDKYYLIYSFADSTSRAYTIAQAVGDTAMGPFRKLTEDEGHIVLSCDYGRYEKLSGSGHHGYFKVGEKEYLAYHRNVTYGEPSERQVCFEELHWVAAKDKDGNDLDVLVSNGPTCTTQPRFDSEAEYVDISEDGKISLKNGKFEKGSAVKWLNDGLVTHSTFVNQGFFDKYVQETVVTADSTFKLDFGEERAVRGVMIYESKWKDKAFRKIKNIVFNCVEDGKEKSYYIAELNIDEKQAFTTNALGDVSGTVWGYAVYAEFGELNVKSIEFTVELPEGQSAVAVSEIAVIGKRKGVA